MLRLRALITIGFVALLAGCSKRAVAPPDSREPDRESTVTTPPPAARESASAPPPAVATSEPWDVSCKNDGDCVPVSASECCPAPCTSTVVNKRDQARVAASLSEQCKKQQREGPCPSAGACRGHAYLCVKSECRLVFEGDPDYRPRRSESTAP